MLLDCINTAVKARVKGMPVDEIVDKLDTYSQKHFGSESENGSNVVDGTVRFLLTPEKQQK